MHFSKLQLHVNRKDAFNCCIPPRRQDTPECLARFLTVLDRVKSIETYILGNGIESLRIDCNEVVGSQEMVPSASGRRKVIALEQGSDQIGPNRHCSGLHRSVLGHRPVDIVNEYEQTGYMLKNVHKCTFAQHEMELALHGIQGIIGPRPSKHYQACMVSFIQLHLSNQAFHTTAFYGPV